MATPTTYRKKTGWQRNVFLKFRSFGLKKQSAYAIQNLAVLIKAGMSITEALASIQEEFISWRMRSALKDVSKKVYDGAPLSLALEEANMAKPYVLSLIELGEKSGRLSENLEIAAKHNEKDAVFRSRIRSALTYSTFVFITALVVGVGVAWFVLPEVASFFNEIDADLPFFTVVIITFGSILSEYGFILIPLLAVFLSLILYFLFSFPKTKFIGHSILFHLPGIGRLIKETEISRLGFIVGTMLNAGVPLREIFTVLPSTTTFRNYKKLYIRMRADIDEGKTFKQIFAGDAKSRKLLPLSVRQMIIGAEQAGSLSTTFNTIGNMYEVRVDQISKNIPVFLEPILLLFIGGIVAFLALGILMPIYQLGLYL